MAFENLAIMANANNLQLLMKITCQSANLPAMTYQELLKQLYLRAFNPEYNVRLSRSEQDNLKNLDGNVNSFVSRHNSNAFRLLEALINQKAEFGDYFWQYLRASFGDRRSKTIEYKDLFAVRDQFATEELIYRRDEQTLLRHDLKGLRVQFPQGEAPDFEKGLPEPPPEVDLNFFQRLNLDLDLGPVGMTNSQDRFKSHNLFLAKFRQHLNGRDEEGKRFLLGELIRSLYFKLDGERLPPFTSLAGKNPNC